MQAQRWICGLMVLAAASLAYGQIDVGSDGSDGAFEPTVSITIDLSTAPSGPWETTKGGDNDGDEVSDGVYDEVVWAVVFKYTSVHIPSGVTVTFLNHPTRAPVVWLATEGILIEGTVNLNGKTGLQEAFAQPGPGGYRGGLGEPLESDSATGGFGLGGASRGDGSSYGSGAGHATAGY